MAVFTNIDIKKRREILKMTAATLAEKVGRDPNTIYNWESGKSDPDPDSMYQIAEAFGDLNVWHDWMRTKYSSYARLHPDTKQYDLPGAMILARSGSAGRPAHAPRDRLRILRAWNRRWRVYRFYGRSFLVVGGAYGDHTNLRMLCTQL